MATSLPEKCAGYLMQRLIDVWAGVERSVDDGIEHAYVQHIYWFKYRKPMFKLCLIEIQIRVIYTTYAT